LQGLFLLINWMRAHQTTTERTGGTSLPLAKFRNWLRPAAIQVVGGLYPHNYKTQTLSPTLLPRG
jgi:hypothetical protein